MSTHRAHRPRRLRRAAALGAAACLAARLAAGEPCAADVWKTLDLYLDCGREFVRSAAAPTVESAHAACDARLVPFVAAVRFTTRLLQPADGAPAAEVEQRIERHVTQTRADARDKFSVNVREWIAERSR